MYDNLNMFMLLWNLFYMNRLSNEKNQRNSLMWLIKYSVSVETEEQVLYLLCKKCDIGASRVVVTECNVPPAGRVFVHCLMGVSRSATLVLAFLMIAEGLTLREAVAAVKPHRDIFPNPGFLQQLRSLDMSLERQRRRQRQSQAP